MVSPRIKTLPSASPSPTNEISKRRILSSRRGNGGENATEKGNFSGYVDRMRSSPPPTPIPVHFMSEMLEDSAPDLRDVMGFRAAGFMDETEMFRNDKEALDDSDTKLHAEEFLVMASPRIKPPPPAFPSPTTETSKHCVLSSRRGAGSRITTQTGNSSCYVDRMGSPPHTPLPVHFVSEMLEDCTPDTRDVIGIREARFMDEPTMVRKDKELLEDNATKLQSEELLVMVSPQIKSLPSAPPSPTIETAKCRVLSSRRGDGSRITTQKGNSAGYIDRMGLPPHTPHPVHFVSEMLEDCTPDTRDVIGFREAGFMDEATMVGKDKEELENSVTKLQSELYDYQLNMGHLLINKADLITQCDDLKHHLEETQESLKRERSAHLIDLREAEDRVDSLREALFLEKQTVVNLERDLSDPNPENSSFSKETLEEKEAGDFPHNPDFDDMDKLCSADVIPFEMENPESLFKMEEAHDVMVINPREYIHEWENKLQEREHKLSEGLQNLNEMEEKAKKIQISLDDREQLCKKTHEEIGLEKMDLKKRENDVNHKLAEISVKEQEIENLIKRLDKREKDLLTYEENINFREKVGIESVLEEHRSLQEKQKVEMENRKASVEKECREMLDSAEKKMLEISHLEEELLKRRHSSDAKAEQLREREDLAERLIRSSEEKKHSLEAEERALDSERETLLRLRLRLESQEAAAKERSDQSLVLEDLKKELENLMVEKTEILNRVEEKSAEKERLEKEVAELNERKTDLGKEIAVLAEEKMRLERLVLSENKRAAETEATRMREALEAERAELTSRNKLLEEGADELRILKEKAEVEKAEVEKAELNSRKKLLEDGTEELRILKEKLEVEKVEMTSRNKILEEGAEELRILKEKVDNEKAEITSRNKILEEGAEELRMVKEKLDNEKAEMTSRKQLLEDATEELRILEEKLEVEKVEITSRKKLLEDDTDHLRILKEKLEVEKVEITSRTKFLEDGTEDLRILKEKFEDEKAAFVGERGRLLSFLEKQEMCSSCGRSVREFSKLTTGKVGSKPGTVSSLRECTASALDPDREVLEASVGGREVARITRAMKKNTVVLDHEKRTAESVPEEPVAGPATDDGGGKVVSGTRKRVRESAEAGEGSGEAEVQGSTAGGRAKQHVAARDTPTETRYKLRTQQKSGVTTRAQKKKA